MKRVSLPIDNFKNSFFISEEPLRVACIDKSRELQAQLKQLIDQAYAACRESVGHLAIPNTYGASAQEVEVNTRPDLAVIGWHHGIEESFRVCKLLRQAHPSLPIFVFFDDADFTLRNLSRFQGVSDEQFRGSCCEPQRLIHKMAVCCERARPAAKGRLFTVLGVKGGVGATSVVSGLAHAGEAFGKRAAVVDLSVGGVFAFYAGADRLYSPDFKSALVQRAVPDVELVQRSMVKAPNGIEILLPPVDAPAADGNGGQVREWWVRDPERFETTLLLVDVLQELYDAVIVDIAATEGVLAYALQSRADVQVLVSTHDPAAVHLLARRLSGAQCCREPAQTKLLLNELSDDGIAREHILEFLSAAGNFDQNAAVLDPLPFDRGARRWIGTGNSFYTEGGRALKRTLERNFAALMQDVAPTTVHPGNWLPRLLGNITASRSQRSPKRRALPAPRQNLETANAPGGRLKPNAADRPLQLPGPDSDDLSSYTPPAVAASPDRLGHVDSFPTNGEIQSNGVHI